MTDTPAAAHVLLNQSQIHTWLSCHHQYELAYGKGLRPRRDKPYLRVGSVGHQVMAALLTGRSAEEAAEKWKKTMVGVAAEAWTDEDMVEIEALHETGYKLAQRAFRELDIGHKWTTVMLDGKPLVEYQFLLPVELGKFTHFSGTVDWVAQDSSGLIYLTDHKFRKQLQPTEAEEHNLQMATYQVLLRKAGINAVGSISHQIRTELPKLPAVNKNGSISKALIISDWETYSAFVKEKGLNPDDYIEMQDKLSEIEFWRMSYAYRNQREVDAIWESCVETVAHEISGRGPKVSRTIRHTACKSCSFANYCWEQMRGGDLQFLEQSQYTFGPSTKPEAFNQMILEADED